MAIGIVIGAAYHHSLCCVPGDQGHQPHETGKGEVFTWGVYTGFTPMDT